MGDVTQCALEFGIDLDEVGIVAGEMDDEAVGAAIKAHKEKLKYNSYRYRYNAQARARTISKATAHAESGAGRLNAAKAVLVRDVRDGANNQSVEGWFRGYLARGNQLMAKAGEALRPSVLGRIRDKELAEDSVRVAMGGKAKNNEAAEIGAQLRTAMDKMFEMYRKVGGQIGKIDNYFPQTHNTARVAQSREEWIQFVTDRLDRDRMVDKEGTPLSNEEMAELLDYVWRNISTRGGTNRTAPKFTAVLDGGDPVSARHSMSRILHFKDPDAFLEYHNAYGEGDLMGAVQNHMRSMALDTALHRVFGVDITKNFNQLKNWAQAGEGQGLDMIDLDMMWNTLVGHGRGGDAAFGGLLDTARNAISAGSMGSTLLASIPDLMTNALNGAMNGMNIPRLLGRMKEYADSGHREDLVRIAGDLDYAASAIAMQMRFENNLGGATSRMLADMNYRVSGTTGWTNAGRHAWMSEMNYNLAQNSGKSYDELPDEVKSFIHTYGLEKEWDIVRRAEKTTGVNGFEYMDLANVDDDHAVAKFLGAMHTERDMAILAPDVRVRAALTAGKAPNTGLGAMARLATQFLSYPASFLVNGIGRYFLTDRLTKMQKSKYMFASMAGMTVLGGISVQLKEMAKGNDPVPMDTPEFVTMAIMQGGALPLLADLALQGETRFGQSALQVAAGPVGGFAVGAVDSVYGYASGDEGQRASRYAEELTRLVPGQSIWYLRAGVKAIRDEMLGAVDPHYEARARRKERNRRNRTDQGTWMGYDNVRSPDLEAFGVGE